MASVKKIWVIVEQGADGAEAHAVGASDTKQPVDDFLSLMDILIPDLKLTVHEVEYVEA